MLEDKRLKDLIQTFRFISDFKDLSEQLQPASFDLTLHDQFTRYLADGELEDNGDRIVLRPGECVLAQTKEVVNIPNDCAARVEGRSSWGRNFVLVHTTAGFIDPGFKGRITLEIVNLSPRVQVIPAGCRICQICVVRLEGECETPYRGKYNGQMSPTPSRIQNEIDSILGHRPDTSDVSASKTRLPESRL